MSKPLVSITKLWWMWIAPLPHNAPKTTINSP